MVDVPAQPLVRPDPKLIQELFDKDPLDLTDQDLDLIIQEFRQDRMSYLQAEKAPKSKAKSSSSAAPAIPVQADLIADLGLDL